MMAWKMIFLFQGYIYIFSGEPCYSSGVYAYSDLSETYFFPALGPWSIRLLNHISTYCFSMVFNFMEPVGASAINELHIININK